MTMRRWCRALLAVALATACGGQSEVHRRHGATTGTTCTTSYACTNDERCEAGTCVPDEPCPGEREPVLLFEAEPGSTFAWKTFQSFTTFGEREFLVVFETDDSGAISGTMHFHELATGREMIFEHDPGYASCGGVPAHCIQSTPNFTSIFEVELGEDRMTLVEGTRFTFYGVDGLMWSEADYRAGEVVVVAGTLVELQTLGHLPPVASVDFGDLRPAWPIADASGRSRRMTAFRQANGAEFAEFAVAALEAGAVPERLYAGPSGQNGLWGLPDEDGWFILRDGTTDEGEDADRTFVYRGSSEGGELLGSIEMLRGSIPVDYMTGNRPLAAGPSVYAYGCTRAEGCESRRLTLDPVGVEEVARVALPEPSLVGDYLRPLACGGADVIVVTSEGTDAPTRYWSLRIPGREGFP
jgi:hypothetical protein